MFFYSKRQTKQAPKAVKGRVVWVWYGLLDRGWRFRNLNFFLFTKPPLLTVMSRVTFFEGNKLSQNQVCTLEWTEV